MPGRPRTRLPIGRDFPKPRAALGSGVRPEHLRLGMRVGASPSPDGTVVHAVEPADGLDRRPVLYVASLGSLHIGHRKSDVPVLVRADTRLPASGQDGDGLWALSDREVTDLIRNHFRELNRQ